MFAAASIALALAAHGVQQDGYAGAPSKGCTAGATLPVTPGSAPTHLTITVPDKTQQGGTAARAYWLQLPKDYDVSKPPLILFDLHGFYDNAKSQISENRIAEWVRSSGTNAVMVSPEGSYDGGDSATWHMDGGTQNLAPGPLGDVCEHNRNTFGVYKCYTSCTASAQGCNARKGCTATSCMDDVGFLTALLDHLQDTVCTDLNHVHFTGISTGAMMALSMPWHVPERVASVVTTAGSRYMGFNTPLPTASKVSYMDIHGFIDNTIPANASNGFKPSQYVGPHGSAVSNDGFFYTPTPNITRNFATHNGCDDSGNLPYPTKFDGVAMDDDEQSDDEATQGWEFSCNKPHGNCGGADVVTCTGEWDHTWAFCEYNAYPCSNTDNAELVIDFMMAHPKVGGNWTGALPDPAAR